MVSSSLSAGGNTSVHVYMYLWDLRLTFLELDTRSNLFSGFFPGILNCTVVSLSISYTSTLLQNTQRLWPARQARDPIYIQDTSYIRITTSGNRICFFEITSFDQLSVDPSRLEETKYQLLSLLVLARYLF